MVAWSAPLDAKIQQGIRMVGSECAGGIARGVVFDIIPHTVLPSESPGGRQITPYPVRDAGDKLMAKIFQRIVGFVDGHIVMSFLVDIGVSYVYLLKEETFTESFMKI